jgi:ComF family protein
MINSPFCVACEFDLPYSHSFYQLNNEVIQHFWGRIKIEYAAALYQFYKGGKVQDIIHQLKYEKRKDIGIYVGQRMGDQLFKSPFFEDIDLIIPVPLHKKRKKKRGYNQSELLAKGILKRIAIKAETKSLLRIKSTQSQTSKSRSERILNISKAFSIPDNARIKGKHILLVDDVITTGATLEICAETLISNGASKISLVCMALAK